ncbi:MAG: OB-fold domain-containing protein [Acidimicrobiia bacterium]|nr:OB-fold domain-containing protein [Acidimicrobiia bacterium]
MAAPNEQHSAKKYVPRPEGLNLEFHHACLANGLVSLQRCTGCGHFRHPPRWYCPNCHSSAYEFAPVSGKGEIYSMAINHFTIDPGWVDELPYVTAVVELAEGPRVVGALRDVAPGEVNLGQAVQVAVEARGEDFAFLWVTA